MLARLLLASPLRDQLKGIAVGDGCICGSINGVACVAPWRSGPDENLEGAKMRTLISMVVSGSLKRWDRWHIIPQLALIYCLLGGYIIPTTF